MEDLLNMQVRQLRIDFEALGKVVGIERQKIIELEKNRDNIYAFLDRKEFTVDADNKFNKLQKELTTNINQTKREIMNKFGKSMHEFQMKHLTVPDLVGRDTPRKPKLNEDKMCK